jgi:uncharacterized protein YgiM (DUF1202 family)
VTSNRTNTGGPPDRNHRTDTSTSAGNGRRRTKDQGDLWANDAEPPSSSQPAEPPAESQPAAQDRPDSAPVRRTLTRARETAPEPEAAESLESRDLLAATRTRDQTAERSRVRRYERTGGAISGGSEATRRRGAAASAAAASAAAASAAAPATGAPEQSPFPDTTTAMPETPAYEYDQPYEDGYEDDAQGAGMLRNPYVLAGIAVALAIIMAVVVVVFFGQGGEGGTGENSAGVNPLTPRAGQAAGLRARSIASATVRDGPGLEFLELGLLRSNRDVTVTGRNGESTWFQIVYPENSNLRGWVPETALRLPDDADDRLAVAESTPRPLPTEEPTSTPVPATATPNVTSTPEATPVRENADIAVTILGGCSEGKSVEIALSNVGQVPLRSAPVRITVSHQGAALFDQTLATTMEPGQSAQLDTKVKAEAPSMTVTVVLQDPQDVNAGNNIATCSVAGGNSNNRGNNSGGGNVPPPIVSATPN